MLDISRKIDESRLFVLKKIKDVADSLQIDFFLVGATVRDIILNSVYDIKIYRATNDIDFAVRVKSWNEYNKLTSEIEKIGFRKDQRVIHRFHSDGLIIDFIPFGKIADKNLNITWQDNDNKIMNVIGFDEAFANTEDILIQSDPEITIKVASIESLVILKIFAWNERTVDVRLKDASDLNLIISNYLKVGNEETLFEYHTDLITNAMDYELTGASLLGRNIARVVSEKVKTKILDILKDDKFELLAKEMTQYEGLFSEREEKLDKCLKLLINIRLGLEDKI